ncbi:hypothetical protein A2U01_0079041, partial [Trifolium medium]|nr:hypothetical protein [Trifolium medium]
MVLIVSMVSVTIVLVCEQLSWSGGRKASVSSTLSRAISAVIHLSPLFPPSRSHLGPIISIVPIP